MGPPLPLEQPARHIQEQQQLQQQHQRQQQQLQQQHQQQQQELQLYIHQLEAQVNVLQQLFTQMMQQPRMVQLPQMMQMPQLQQVQQQQVQQVQAAIFEEQQELPPMEPEELMMVPVQIEDDLEQESDDDVILPPTPVQTISRPKLAKAVVHRVSSCSVIRQPLGQESPRLGRPQHVASPQLLSHAGPRQGHSPLMRPAVIQPLKHAGLIQGRQQVLLPVTYPQTLRQAGPRQGRSPLFQRTDTSKTLRRAHPGQGPSPVSQLNVTVIPSRFKMPVPNIVSPVSSILSFPATSPRSDLSDQSSVLAVPLAGSSPADYDPQAVLRVCIQSSFWIWVWTQDKFSFQYQNQ